MKILFINAYFYPELIAFSHLERDLIDALIERGHTVEVICPAPTRGVSEQTRRLYLKRRHETVGGAHVTRFWAPPERKNPVLRMLRYVWCNLRSYSLGKRKRGIDAVFAVSTPPTQGLTAGRLAKKLDAPFVYSLQDVFPDSLAATGLASKSSPLYKLGARIEKKTYRLCTRIIVLSRAMERNLLDKGVERERLITVGNWIDTEKVRPVGRADNRLFDELGLDRGQFNAVYAGNLGASQGAEVILSAAERLSAEPSVRFVIFGGGSGYESVCAAVRDRELGNVSVFPLLPAERVSEVYSLGDAALITCKRGMGGIAMPSKLWSIMACGTPIIASFDRDSELAAALEESGAGVCVEPEDPSALAEAVMRAVREPINAAGSRAYAEEHASKELCVRKYTDCIENAVGSREAISNAT